MFSPRLVSLSCILTLAVPCALLVPRGHALAETIAGIVTGQDGAAIPGAMVSVGAGSPEHRVTVFTDHVGHFATPGLEGEGPFGVRVRRIGWRDRALSEVAPGARLEVALEKETDAAALAAQLPANRWYSLLLEELDAKPQLREQLVRQCTYCHQQGSFHTRLERSPEQWGKVISLMGRMGAVISPALAAEVPEIYSRAYAPQTAVARLTADRDAPDFAPPPPPSVRGAVIEEWDLGHPASMQHDVAMHPDGRLYSVDMMQDMLYRLDPSVPGGERRSWPVPPGDLELGGVLASGGAPTPPTANARVGPHSLQVAPDGAIWTTLALGNQLARFDPSTETWTFHPLEKGFYPHTLRFDQRGRIWYTVAVSNHVGVLDPATGAHQWIRLPTRSWSQALVVRIVPVFLWLAERFDLAGAAAGEGGGGSDLPELPIPYGIDVSPTGDIWFSQLNNHQIGRIDPETFEVEMVETPFSAPRRLRFDSRGRLWIPGFSSGLVARFDVETREFKTWPLPIEPLGSDTPYALNIDRRSDTVWICGTNSDTLIRFEPATERFSVYPLPTRVTYTREIDFDAQGRVWTSNSNMPSWQIEDGRPKVIRLDPGSPTEPQLSGAGPRPSHTQRRAPRRFLP